MEKVIISLKETIIDPVEKWLLFILLLIYQDQSNNYSKNDYHLTTF